MKEDIINKIFPTENMRCDFLEYTQLQTTESREAFMQAKEKELASLSKVKRAEQIDMAIQAGVNAVQECKDLMVLRQLQSVSPYISLSEISKTYFGKSRGWLSQRLHENEVRGKKVSLKPEEINTLRAALLDLSDKLKTTAFNLGGA